MNLLPAITTLTSSSLRLLERSTVKCWERISNESQEKSLQTQQLNRNLGLGSAGSGGGSMASGLRPLSSEVTGPGLPGGDKLNSVGKGPGGN